jgi:quercetin dioxygenase-like cupin family protein
MARTYRLTPSESVTVRSHSQGELIVEAEYGPRGSPPPPHYHPDQDERFEVLTGVVHAVTDGKEHTLREGDTLDIPRGTVHRLWNPGDVPARVTWRTAPAGDTLDWFAALDATGREGPGRPSPLALAALLTRYRGVLRLAQRPRFLVSAALSLLAALGRLRGYRPPAPPRLPPEQHT